MIQKTQQLEADLALCIKLLADCGLDRHGLISIDSLSARESASILAHRKTARSVLVVGSSGPQMWSAMKGEMASSPRFLSDEPHPIDAFVVLAIGRCDSTLNEVPRDWVFCSATSKVSMDFRALGAACGMGLVSQLGLLIHPEVGPWLGMRAACFLDVDLEPSPKLTVNPCDSCVDKPCETACPVSAYDNGVWDVSACAGFHITSQKCDRTCWSREACPVGIDGKYSDEQLLYHSNRKAGRLALAKSLNITDDTLTGVGPNWADWA